MDSFSGKLAAVTGGASGMGRELVRQLAAQGCSVAACDWHPDTVAETAALARAAVVMPGHVGTGIIGNTLRAHGKDPEQLSEAQLKVMISAGARAGLVAVGLLA